MSKSIHLTLSNQECNLIFTAIHGYLNLKKTTDPSWASEPNLAPMMNQLSKIIDAVTSRQAVQPSFSNIKAILCALVMSSKVMHHHLSINDQQQLARLESKMLILGINSAPSNHKALLLTEDVLLHRVNHFLYY